MVDLLDKVPPYSAEAEMAVLGSMLIEKEALERALELLNEQSFYEEPHQKIFNTIKTLSIENKVVDTVTLAEELRRQQRLASVGGGEYVARLINSVGTAAHIDHYAQIVREKAILRELIRAATHVVGECFKENEDANSLLDRAEGLIYSISDAKEKGGLVPISDMLQEMLHDLENLHRKKENVTGVPTGFKKFDEMTAGLQPGNLIILAARPGVGKTSLALNIASYVALERKIPVAFFSLEMSHREIVMRLLSSVTDVHLQRLRTGFFEKSKWPLITRKAEVLSEAPIELDSSSAMSILTLRAAARRFAMRLKAKGGPLGLIIIDYLQLMQGSRRNPENRQNEIAEISRSLKGLARNLNVPILALSQLNRSPEERGREGKPQLSHLRECVTGDTLVYLSDGRCVPIIRLIGQTPIVWAMTPVGKFVAARSDKVWHVGRRPVVKLRLASGRSISVTRNHRLWTLDGWLPVSQLKVNDRLAIPRSLPEPETCAVWPEDRLSLLGQLIGDGSYLVHQPMRYTTASEENSAIVLETASREFGARVKRYVGRGRWHQLLISGNGDRWHPSGVGLWLKELGIFGQRSHEKRIPQELFRLPNRQIAILLQHLWATDGTIAPRRTGPGGHAVSYSTNSEKLSLDVSSLLLRFGIVSRIQRVPQGTYRPVYMVCVSGTEDQRRFLREVGAFGPRVEAAKRLAGLLEGLETNTNVDTLPNEIFSHVKELMRRQGISQRQMAAMRGTSYGGAAHFKFSPSRAVVSEYASLLGDDSLMTQATSDLFWDRIASIEPVGDQDVYDLTVPDPSSWVANGIVSHNSGALEQDADMVVFIYREGMYKPDADETTRRNAKLIIAKQRNGPLGEINLVFMGECARFGNPERESE